MRTRVYCSSATLQCPIQITFMPPLFLYSNLETGNWSLGLCHAQGSGFWYWGKHPKPGWRHRYTFTQSVCVLRLSGSVSSFLKELYNTLWESKWKYNSIKAACWGMNSKTWVRETYTNNMVGISVAGFSFTHCGSIRCLRYKARTQRLAELGQT